MSSEPTADPLCFSPSKFPPTSQTNQPTNRLEKTTTNQYHHHYCPLFQISLCVTIALAISIPGKPEQTDKTLCNTQSLNGFLLAPLFSKPTTQKTNPNPMKDTTALLVTANGVSNHSVERVESQISGQQQHEEEQQQQMDNRSKKDFHTSGFASRSSADLSSPPSSISERKLTSERLFGNDNLHVTTTSSTNNNMSKQQEQDQNAKG